MADVGILGGTFNPPHVGHLVMVIEALDQLELDREGPSYTVDTLRALREAAPDDELFLVLGGDQAAALASWHEPEQVLERATVAVFERASWGRNAIVIKIGRLAGARNVRYLDMPMIQVSSSGIRRRVREGAPIRYLVPDNVASYIEDRALYGAKEAVAT